MLTFSSFIKACRVLAETNSAKGTYIAVYPDDDTLDLIGDLAEKIGVDLLPLDGLHATILYSRKTLDHDACGKLMHTSIPVHGTGDELTLFDQQDGKKCLVIKITNLELLSLHTTLRKMGGTHDFPSYHAHVTLCRDLPHDFEIPKEEISIPMRFNDYTVQHLKEDAV